MTKPHNSVSGLTPGSLFFGSGGFELGAPFRHCGVRNV